MHAPIVLILHDSPVFAQSLHQRVLTIHPAATLLVTSRIREADSLLATMRIDIFLAGIEASDGDLLDLLLHRSREAAAMERTLVVGRPGARALVTFCRLRVAGVFDPEEPIENLDTAIRQVKEGGSYWSHTFTKALASEDVRLILHQLSPTEQLALATMGDGCGDKTAAERLGMTLHAARSIRQDLYAKLGVHDKEGLQRMAARMSFTRFSPEGVVAMGLARLVVEYIEGSKRPVALPQATLARHGFAHVKSGGARPAFQHAGVIP